MRIELSLKEYNEGCSSKMPKIKMYKKKIHFQGIVYTKLPISKIEMRSILKRKNFLAFNLGHKKIKLSYQESGLIYYHRHKIPIVGKFKFRLFHPQNKIQIIKALSSPTTTLSDNSK